MKHFLFLALCIIQSYSSPTLQPSLTQHIGNACQSNGVYNISTFDLTPFPPQVNTYSTATIQGTFNQSAFVSQIDFMFKASGQTQYQYDNINQLFQQGAAQTFTYQLLIPQSHGSWTVTVNVQQQNPQAVLGCWTFQFND